MGRPTRGKLIVFEGPDGVGKSTVSKQLATRLRDAGIRCEHRSFPGKEKGSLGRFVYDLHHRAISLNAGSPNATSLQLMHIAAHIDAIEGHILPALRAGVWVILDRYWWSTEVYGETSGVPKQSLDTMIGLEKLHWGQIKPDVVFLLGREKSPAGSPAKLRNMLTDYYRELANRERTHSRVVSLNNDFSIGRTLDAAWDAIRTDVGGLSREPEFGSKRQKGAQLQLLGDSDPSTLISSRFAPTIPTVVFDTFWKFAAERQRVFYRRFQGFPPPWTNDPILLQFKFTNAYRASDRVSQYLIRKVIYEGAQTPEEIFFRIILFKVFNRIDTWERLEAAFGEIEFTRYSFDHYDAVLTRALSAGQPIYSSAYIMPSAGRVFGYPKKHRNHLRLIERMMADDLPQRIASSRTMQDAFNLLRSYPSIGNFLAYQFVTDLNYSKLTDFSEMEFVVPGPGAVDGIRKCFADLGGLTEVELIKLVTECQEDAFDRLGIQFRNLWGRRLQLIDCQNLFCEISKYARVKHPNVRGTSNRWRIKHVYRPTRKPIEYWYPPKWGINDRIRQNPTWTR